MMAPGRMRCTRRLRSWLVDQVSSGKYRGLVWDDDEKTMFRIPWKHAAKHDFRSEEDAAIFKAWAEFKGKLCEDDPAGPASWKTRLRCALNKSPEFSEVTERSQLDISEPYKVYRLVPLDEQGLTDIKKEEDKEREVKKSKRRKRQSETETEEEITKKWIKEESASAVRSITAEVDITTGNNVTYPSEAGKELSGLIKHDGVIDEIQLNFTVETESELSGSNPDGTIYPNKNIKDCPSFFLTVYYVGLEVLRREVRSDDLRIVYDSASLTPPSFNSSRFFRVSLPPPLSDLTSCHSSSISSLLSFMEAGVILSLTPRGVYAKRFSQGRVFWRGPHSGDHSTRKMERGVKPMLIFDQELFKQDLEQFRNGGEKPETEVTLCFGEELQEGDDLSKKLIILKVGLPWAEQQVKLETDRAWSQSVSILQSLAQQSPSGEITLSLVQVPDASL